jgi:molybdopterin/thiamine biosynthesis adenylyltransferase
MERIKQINSSIAVEPHQCRITKTNAQTLVSKYDVVLDGSDNALTRYIINDACVIEKVN